MPIVRLLTFAFLDQMQWATAPGKLIAWAATDRIQWLIFIIGACLIIVRVLVRFVYFADRCWRAIGVNRPSLDPERSTETIIGKDLHPHASGIRDSFGLPGDDRQGTSKTRVAVNIGECRNLDGAFQAEVRIGRQIH